MAISHLLAPMPKWYIADLTGKPLGGGSMYTYSTLDKTTFMYVYQDPAGKFPWPDPVLFDENGSQGPFYWEVDSLNLQNTYYIEVYDANGVLQWTIDNFSPPGGGGGSATEAISVNNLIVNNVMYRNFGTSADPTNATFIKLSPGAHDGLSNNVSNSAGLYTGSDICFIKNNTVASDQIQFLPFTLGSSALNGDETPYQYLNYVCGNSPAGETIKCVQYPITRRVQNLNNVSVVLTIWARCNSGNTSLALSWLQFFGDGVGATSPITTLIENLTLTSAWQQFTVTATVPSVSSKNLGSMGACGNDALFLQVGYPLGEPTNIDFTKLCVYLGNNAPTAQYTPYDMINAVISSPRTGYAYAGYDTVAPYGYLIMDDGTIGSAASGATSNGGLGASVDSFALYCLLWNNVSSPSSNAYAPVTGGLGASAVADFIANKTLQLPLALGRALAGAGSGSGLTARTLGEYFGAESTTEVPNHTHPFTANSANFYGSSGTISGSNPGTSGGAFDLFTKAPTGTTGNNNGGVSSLSLMNPTTYMNFFIKL